MSITMRIFHNIQGNNIVENCMGCLDCTCFDITIHSPMQSVMMNDVARIYGMTDHASSVSSSSPNQPPQRLASASPSHPGTPGGGDGVSTAC